MTNRFLLSLLLPLGVCLGLPADLLCSQEVGARVVVISDNAKTLKNGEDFGEIEFGEHIYVEETAPNFCVFRRHGEVLWIRHKDIATIPDALEFFNARLENKITASDLTQRARILYYLNRFDEAMRDLDEAEELDDTILQIYINRSAIFCERNDYDYALEEIELAEQIAPHHPTVLNILGLIAYHEDEYEKALAYYNRCLESDASYSVAYSNRALVYIQLGENEKAIEDYEKSIDVMPARSTGYTNYAWYLTYYTEEYDKALDYLNRALELNPRDPRARHSRADVHYEREEYAEYVRDLKVAVDASPDKIEWKNDLAWFIATTHEKELRNGKRALEYALAVVEKSEWSDPDHITTLAAAYGATEQFEKALEVLEKASDVDRYDSYVGEITDMHEAFRQKTQYYIER